MSLHTPQFAAIVVMAFLGSSFAVMGCAFIAVLGILRKSRSVALGAVAAAAMVALAYTSVLLGTALLSKDVELPQGSWKYFCEIDCHVAYSVVGVRVVSMEPAELELNPSTAGRFVIVQLRTWFDPSTTSPHRGNGPLMPSTRRIRLVDSMDHEFPESAKTEAVLAAKGCHSIPLRTALRPGESYDSYLVFEAPESSRDFRLLVTSAEELDAALWGHEISPFHGKAYFQITGTRLAARQ